VSARKYAAAVPIGLALPGGFGLLCFIVALLSGATFALAVALGLGGGVVVGALYAARQNPERLLPLACIASAAALFASELMTTFQLSSAPGQTLCNVGASGRHHFAIGILAIFAVGAVVVAVMSASKPAAISVGVAGVIALVLFLTIDLPQANNVGNISTSCDLAGSFDFAKAEPQAGFWLEMVGALALALSGVALGTLNPEQLRAIRPKWLGGGKRDDGRRPDRAPSLSEPDAERMTSGGDHDRRATAARRRTKTRGGRRT
jgi:hypothetical protein